MNPFEDKVGPNDLYWENLIMSIETEYLKYNNEDEVKFFTMNIRKMIAFNPANRYRMT